MDTSDKNSLIAELDEISRRYTEKASLAIQISELPFKKEQKKKNVIKPSNKVKKINIGKVKNAWNNKLFKKAGFQGLICKYYAFTPPKHWFSKENAWDFSWKNYFNELTALETKNKIYDAYRAFDKVFLSMIPEYKENYEAELKKYIENQDRCRIEQEKYEDELATVDADYKKLEKELSQKKEEISKQLDSVTIISKDFIPDAGRIAKVLKQGRADTLKEAINLVCDEKRKDAEEAQRREEAERQEQILWEQAYENRKHNERMQRVAEEEARATREHNAAMERAAQSQVDILRKSQETQQRAASARCATCANRSTCSYEKKKAYSCSSYRPS